MDELIANNKLEYENIAIELANDKLKLDKIKNKLIINTKKFNLFNNKEIKKELEKIYKRLLNNRY